MQALPTPQQSDWNNNVYVLATTRIFVVMGLAYLIKSLFSLVSSTWGTRSASIASAVAEGIDLENVVPDTLVTLPGIMGTDPDLEANVTLEMRPPQPTYDPQNHTEGSWVNARAQDHGSEVSEQPATAQASPEHEVGIGSGEPHNEVTDTGIDDARRDTAFESARDEGNGETATRSPGHAICRSFSA